MSYANRIKEARAEADIAYYMGKAREIEGELEDLETERETLTENDFLPAEHPNVKAIDDKIKAAEARLMDVEYSIDILNDAISV